MHVSWGLVRSMLLSAIVLALLSTGVTAAPAREATASAVRQQTADDWQPTVLSERVWSVAAPASGALFAVTESALMRSDDGGATWRAIELPPYPEPRSLVAVDPTDHTVLYARGTEGLYKSDDDAASWHLILPISNVTARQLTIRMSPADQNLVYVDAASGSGHQLQRSRDGGTTWEVVGAGRGDGCQFSVLLLYPHPTDADRVFRAYACRVGAIFWTTMGESRDQAATWRVALDPMDRSLPGEKQRRIWPSELAGGAGVEPRRLYASGCSGTTPISSVEFTVLYRSDDDGASWNIMGSLGDEPCITALVADPSQPDRVYVGLRNGVMTSANGGQSWSDLGRRDLGRVYELALGVDGKNLYAATDTGLHRMAIP